MSTFLNSTILAPRGYIYDNDYQYHKLIGKDQNQNDLIFSIVHMTEWDNDLGFNIEFKMNNDPLLMAYCTDEADFIQVLNSFNV